MATPTFTGGDKLFTRLRDIAANVKGGTTLKVGFLEGATNTDGISIPLIAASNEFGAKIPARQVPEHQAEIFNKINRDGSLGAGGKFVRRSKSNFARTVTIPAHTIPAIKIPARPFFRRMISLGKGNWGGYLGKFLKSTDYSAKLSMDMLGEKMEGELVQSITDQVYAPLAKSTVSSKGFAQTLVASGDMKRAVAHEIAD